MLGGVEVLPASVFSAKTQTNSSCGSEDKSGGVGIVRGTWRSAALWAPRRSCAHEYRGGPVVLSCRPG